MGSRISRTELNMGIAKLISLRGTCDRAVVGCVITREGRIIATGYNSSPAGLEHCHDVGCGDQTIPGCKRTVHAEAGAISFAARYGVALKNSTLYVTLSPCIDCAKLIINAGIKRVIYGQSYRDSSGIDLLRKAGVEVEYYGV